MPGSTHVVLGASSGAGNAITHALAAHGRTVRAVNRSGNAPVPPGGERVAVDVTDPEALANAVTGADVVFMSAQPGYPRWVSEFPPMVASVIDAVAKADARLVMVDNLYMYAPSDHPLTEQSAIGASTRKGRVRMRLDAMLHEAAAQRGLRIVIGRASDYFGPGPNTSAVTALAIEPGMRGRPIRWFGRLDKKHSVAYLPDIARAYVTLAESDHAYGSTWILPHGPAPTGAEFLAAVNHALPHPVKTGTVSPMMLRAAALFNREARESLEMLYQWTDDFVVDDTKFRATFGPFNDTPLHDAVASSVAPGAHTP